MVIIDVSDDNINTQFPSRLSKKYI